MQPEYNVILTNSRTPIRPPQNSLTCGEADFHERRRAMASDGERWRANRKRVAGLAARVARINNALMEQEQGVGSDGGIVGDDALEDHFLEPGPRHPFLAHVLLFMLSFRRARLEPGRQEEMSALAAGAVRAVQEAELDQVPGPQPGFLQQFQPGEFFWLARLPVREAALRERPGAPADRVAELLDQVKAVVLGRDDERVVGLLDERVGAAGAVAPFNLVQPQPHPVILVDDSGRERADVRAVWRVRTVWRGRHRLWHLLGSGRRQLIGAGAEHRVPSRLRCGALPPGPHVPDDRGRA